MINRQLYKKMKPFVEEKLRDYPYYLMSIEMSGLGSAVPPNVIIDKSLAPGDPVGKSIVENEYKSTIVNAVNYVLDNKLNSESKVIIENAYFNNLKTRDEVITELNINKNKYYKLKDDALYKFMIAFGVC